MKRLVIGQPPQHYSRPVLWRFECIHDPPARRRLLDKEASNTPPSTASPEGWHIGEGCRNGLASAEIQHGEASLHIELLSSYPSQRPGSGTPELGVLRVPFSPSRGQRTVVVFLLIPPLPPISLLETDCGHAIFLILVFLIARAWRGGQRRLANERVCHR